MPEMKSLQDFVEFATRLKGDEKGEAQLFCDRLFRAFGHGGVIEANGTLEARIKFSTSGRTKFADCLWAPPGRDGVLIEMKRRSERNLEAHFPQVRDYWIEMNPEVAIGPGAQKPKYVVLCDFDRFLIYRQLSLVDDVPVGQLVDRASALNFLLPEEREPIFHSNVEEISQEAARSIGEVFKHLVFDRKVDREVAQRFLLQCVIALFSEDFGLLPQSIFTELVHECRGRQSTYDLLGGLFSQMASEKRATGGRYKEVRYFDGGLFENVEPLDLDSEGVDLLADAACYNWKNVSPAIFGALFEGTMGEEERHRYGAHFTSEVDILKIVNPTIVRPWKERINSTDTLQGLSDLLDELGRFRVLDPACGCGNFLYVAFRALKDIEMQIVDKISDSFSARSARSVRFGVSRISPKQFYGIDVLPVAVEVARVTMMLGKELAADEWNRRISSQLSMLGLTLDTGLPLDRLESCIVCDDALFCEWPSADVVIGNPPYQSKNKMQAEMDKTYIDRVRSRYADVPGRADYCVYWFQRTHDELEEGQRAGLVGTNTIRQNYSRQGGLDYIVSNGGTITDAVSTQVWPGDAVVHVSIVNWVKAKEEGKKQLAIQHGDTMGSPFTYHELPEIGSALSLAVDVTPARDLSANTNPKMCFQGQTHGHAAFLMECAEAESLISRDARYADVLFPFLTANDLIGGRNSLPSRYVIDFRMQDVFAAREYMELFSRIELSVLPDRQAKAAEEERRNAKALARNPDARLNRHHWNFLRRWWRLSYPRDELMDTIASLPRYCSCGQVTKRPIFEFVSSDIHPNAALMVFSVADDYSFGILQSAVHWEWFTARCSSLKGDPRYTSNTVFDSFPWPQTPKMPEVRAVARAASTLRKLRRREAAQHQMSLRDLYRLIEEAPSNPISEAQDQLDDAVFKVYGMERSEDILSFLLGLNLEISDREAGGQPVVGPGLPACVDTPEEFITDDCIRMA